MGLSLPVAAVALPPGRPSGPGRVAAVGRTMLWASLALVPATIVLRFVFQAGDVTLFAVSAASLVPLAWLIGEATEHAAEHTGPGVGGFLNASFGNAPELIISLFAVGSGLPNVVRGSIAGSVVSNLLLVLGMALLVSRGDGRVDRTSLWGGLAIVLCATLLFLAPSVPGWSGDPDRYELALASVPVASLLLLAYLVQTARSLRRHRRLHLAAATEPDTEWTLPFSLVVLAAATAATAVVSEILVHSLEGFAAKAGISEFFIAAVIVAIVGNAAEHGGAVIIARRGKVGLAAEIAVASGAQVALLVAPAVALLSWAVAPGLALSFRPVELATMAAAALLGMAVFWDRRGVSREGALLLLAYALAVALYWAAGDR
ncbi:MAG: cation transporter [Thermoleophilia bacterium]